MTKNYDPLNDGKSRIELIDYMGGDLAVVNDARASFNKVSNLLTNKDIDLIYYLVKHQHTSPFRSTIFKFKVKAPLFIARQWWKHVVASTHTESQLSWNEKSLRYVQFEDNDDFYVPLQFLHQSKINKQASEGDFDEIDNKVARAVYHDLCRTSYHCYQELIRMGVSREQARGILVPANYTEWVWTVSLQALLHFINLRNSKSAQSEIAQYAKAIIKLIEPIVPETIKAWEHLKQ